MNIGVIGSGNIGSTAARLFAAAGHRVAISNSRGPETLAGLVEEIGPGVRAATVDEAAEFGEVVMEAIPFGRYESLPADKLSGKVFITASNYYPARDGEVEHGGLASSELIQNHLPGARVVKAFNTIYFGRLRDNGRPGGRGDARREPAAGTGLPRLQRRHETGRGPRGAGRDGLR